ncbi:MAG: hypothetical protein CMH26_00090 [Micavibrio sp.]|nr:hypothetical protein [Micavibrio sp.]
MKLSLAHNDSEERAKIIAHEYEDFAYIVSHDLNAPLRHVKEFTRLLVGAREQNLTQEEKEYVGFLRLSLDKLEEMQAALLAFSRLNTANGPMELLDLNETLSMVLAELEPKIERFSPAFEADKLPKVFAEPKQMKLLFLCLLDNAIKFHHPQSPKRKVGLYVTDQGDSWLFEVRDNGIGIAEGLEEQVFRMFRRLQPDDYSGIGAGLTIAHKIVQLHDGEMVIESIPEKGTSVFFCLPKA